MGLPAGRIALDRIANEWSENQPLNPRLLAAEVADAIRSMSQPGTPVPPDCAVIVGVLDATAGLNSVTMWAVADYFDGMSMGQAPATIATTNGGARAGTVLLARYWIDRLATEATERAAVATGLAQAIETPPTRSNGRAALAYIEPEPLSGSDPVCLAIRQEQQRQEGAKNLLEQLEAAQAARQYAEQEAVGLRAERDALAAQLQYFQEETELWRRTANEELRAKLAAEERMREECGAKLLAEEKIEKSEKRAETAESALDALPSKFPELGRQLAEVLALFGKKPAQRRTPSSKVLLLTVAGLLELLLDRRRPPYDQGAAAAAIALRGWRGAGARQVNDVFAEARKEAKEARKEAVTKAMDMQDNNATPPD
ncbi:hypothetical protein [Azotobacter armeniacus]